MDAEYETTVREASDVTIVEGELLRRTFIAFSLSGTKTRISNYYSSITLFDLTDLIQEYAFLNLQFHNKKSHIFQSEFWMIGGLLTVEYL